MPTDRHGLGGWETDDLAKDVFDRAVRCNSVPLKSRAIERHERLASIRRAILDACADAAVLVLDADTADEALLVRKRLADLIPLLQAQEDIALERADKLCGRTK